jgi:hypothetical protein
MGTSPAITMAVTNHEDDNQRHEIGISLFGAQESFKIPLFP